MGGLTTAVVRGRASGRAADSTGRPHPSTRAADALAAFVTVRPKPASTRTRLMSRTSRSMPTSCVNAPRSYINGDDVAVKPMHLMSSEGSAR